MPGGQHRDQDDAEGGSTAAEIKLPLESDEGARMLSEHLADHFSTAEIWEPVEHLDTPFAHIGNGPSSKTGWRASQTKEVDDL